jgi:acetyl esterase/lipase
MSRVRFFAAYLFARGRTYRYGSHRSQRAELHLPRGAGPFQTIVLIHGGSWRKHYGRRVTRALARDLVGRGWAVWNIEYRRVGGGGGWPQTFADVAAAIDRLDGLHPALDLTRVQAIGHSAGGHLALWAAGREQLPSGAPGAREGSPRVPLARVISLAGVSDLAGAYAEWNGGAVRELMGDSPEHAPERYAIADPLQRVPLSVPALLFHGVLDETVSVRLARRYARAAADAGAEVELVEIEGEAGAHRAFIYPDGAAWAAVAERL